MSQDKPNLREVKAAAKSQYGHVKGVQGFGIGESSLRVYIHNEKVRGELPSEIQGVPVEFVVVGDITASDAPKKTQAA